MVVAIILAGGVGTRVGADRPKQFVEVLDKPVLAYNKLKFFVHLHQVSINDFFIEFSQKNISVLSELL